MRLLLVGSLCTAAASCGGGSTNPGTDSGVVNGIDMGTPCDPVRFTTTSDTVTDASTGLTWQRYQAPGQMTFADAQAYCAGLTTAGLAWRIPTITELQSIVVLGAYPTIDSCAFPLTAPSWFWSSTPVGGMSNWIQKVYFAVGNTGAEDPAYSLRLRCVH